MGNSLDNNRMIEPDFYIRSATTQKSNKIHHVWFDGSKMNGRFPWTTDIDENKIFGGSDSKSRIECKISGFWSSFQMNSVFQNF